MTDLQHMSAVHPLTGETLDVARAPDEHLARFLADVKEAELLLKETKAVVSREVIGRLDREGSWTLHTKEGWVLKSQSPEPVEEFDTLALRADLWMLVDEGVISEEAADRAVETIIEYKPRKAGINALRKLGGRVRETIERHSSTSERRRYVSVSRVP